MTNYIDRYVAAAVDDFPGGDNAAIARDVRAALEDIVDARLADGLSQEEAERAAVEELGNPAVFAEQFRQEPRYLIGPKVFRPWWAAMRIALAFVIPLFVALGVLDFAASDNADGFDLFGKVVGGIFEGILQVSFWVTLTFVIIELAGGTSELLDDDEEWTADDLPKTTTGRQITIGEVIANVMALVGASYLAVRFQADHLGAMGLNKVYDLPAETRVFNPELSRWWAVAFFALLVLTLLVSIGSVVRGYWTRNVLTVNLIENGLWLAFFGLLATAPNIINPEIAESSTRVGEWDISGNNSNTILIGIGLVIVLWDIFEAVKGHIAYRRQVAQGVR